MFIIENDIRNVLPQRDLDILLEKSLGQDGQDFLIQRASFAVNFVKSKIQHRYDSAQIFFDVNIFDITTAYSQNDLIYYTEVEYDNTVTYSLDDRVSYNNYIYKYINATPGAGNLPTDTAYWGQVIRDKQYYKVLPETGSVSEYPENTTNFELGDIRDSLILTYVLYVAIYELFKKVQPNMVPEWIVQSRVEVVEHLNRMARGLDTVDLPIYEDEDKGQEITYQFKYDSQNFDF